MNKKYTKKTKYKKQRKTSEKKQKKEFVMNFAQLGL